MKSGLLLGDKGYLGQSVKDDLMRERQQELETPLRNDMSDPLPKEWRGLL